MKSSLLFWGFQDLKFIEQTVIKLKEVSRLKYFYVQINDLDKTISLKNINPDEVIRSKYDLNNLYQWLIRYKKEDILVLIDVFNIVFSGNIEENLLSLKKILNLKLKVCFLSPKVLYPQSIKIMNDSHFDILYHNIVELNKVLKSIYETILNSGSNSIIIAVPISEDFILNHKIYNLFQPKIKYKCIILPELLKIYSMFYISQTELCKKFINIISNFINSNKLDSCLNYIEANCVLKHYTPNFFQTFKPTFFISLEHFLDMKSNSGEHKYILWLMYLAICEYEVNFEKSNKEALLEEYFFKSL